MGVSAGDAARSGVDASAGEGDVTGTGIGVKVSAGDAARSCMDASLGEGDVAGTEAREVKAERSSTEEAPTAGEDDPLPERPTEEDKDKHPPW